MRLSLFLLVNILLQLQQSIYSQTSLAEKNSLLQQYSGQNQVEKIKSLDKIVDYYLRNNLDSARFFNQILYNEAIKMNTKATIANYYSNAGILALKNNHPNKAIELLQKAIRLAKQDDNKNKLADYYKNIAGIYFEKNELDKAIEFTFKSYKLYEQMNNKKGIVMSLDHLGLLHKTTGNMKQAKRYFMQALSFAKTKNTEKKLPVIYQNLGSVYKRIKQPDSSLYYYNLAEKGYSKIHSDEGLAGLYFDKANVWAFYFKNIDSAQFYYQKSLKFTNVTNQKEKVYARLGKLYSLLKNYPLSNDYLHKALAISIKENDWHGLQYGHFYLYQNFKNLKKWDSAVYHLENFIDYQDSLKEKQAKIQIADLESRYENKKKQLEIEKMQLKQQKDKQIKHLLIGGLLLSLLILAFLARNFALRRKKNLLEKELLRAEKEKMEQALQHKTRELTTQALIMLQKNKLLEEIMQALSSIKNTGSETYKEIKDLKRRLKRSMQSEKDWELFRQYFEEINKNFFKRLKEINDKITPSELKLAALIKLRFSIKETASLLNISEGSVKTARYQLRKKLGLKRSDNIYDFLNGIT